MTDDQLDTAAFVFLNELKLWKRIDFKFDASVVVRADTHEQHSFKSEEDANDFIKRRAASALLRFYHEEQARATGN